MHVCYQAFRLSRLLAVRAHCCIAASINDFENTTRRLLGLAQVNNRRELAHTSTTYILLNKQKYNRKLEN